MTYPIEILENALKDVKKEQSRCIENDFESESILIRKTKSLPLKMAIQLLQMTKGNDIQKILEIIRIEPK